MVEDLGMFVGSRFVMLTENSGVRCESLKCIAISSAEQKDNGLNICTDLLQHGEAGESFMELIITGYETWVHVYDFETKQQSL
jgi:hypothetical protein